MKPLSKSTKKNTKKSTKKFSATRRGTGKAAWDKGKKFEDQVAELYRLLGAKVVQSIEIHQKKVDILATFRIPGSSYRQIRSGGVYHVFSGSRVQG